jgi:YVTN family beta-propeller protein
VASVPCPSDRWYLVSHVEYVSWVRRQRRLAVVAAVAFVVAGCARSPSTSTDAAAGVTPFVHGSRAPIASSGVGLSATDRLYVADQAGGTLSVIDTGAQRVIRSIPLRSPTGAASITAETGMAIDSSGTRAFVSTLGAGLQEIDLAAGRVLAIDQGSDGYAVAAGSSKLAFVLQVGGGGTPEVVPMDASDHAGTPLTVGAETDNVQALALAPDGDHVYALLFQGALIPIDTRTLQVGQSIHLPADANGLAISPDSQTAYVTEGSAPGVVSVDLTTGVVAVPIHLGQDPYGIAITPNGKTLYITDGESVIPLDLATAIASPPINLRAGVQVDPDAVGGPIVVSADGITAYAADSTADTVTPINTATRQPGRPIQLGARPVALALGS